MRTATRLLPALLIVVTLILVSSRAEAQGAYTYTVIAEAPPCLFPCEGLLPGLAINAKGTVAFLGCLGREPERRCGIYTGRGGKLRLIAGLRANPGLGAVANGRFGALSVPSINADGVVAFYGSHETQGSGVFTGSGGATTQVVDTRGEFSSVGPLSGNAPGISSDRDVAFTGCLKTGECGLFTAREDGIKRIADVNPFSMNANGVVAFLGDRDGQGGSVFTASPSGRLSLVGDLLFPPGMIVFDVPAINARGVVSIISCFEANCASGWGIFTARAGQLPRLVVDTQTFGGFVTASAINANGEVAFFGCRGERSDLCGIFTGPDPVADRVIQESDALLGTTVRDVCCFGPPFVLALDNQMLNDRGQIAFAALLSDGRSVIVRADPEGGTGDDAEGDGELDAEGE